MSSIPQTPQQRAQKWGTLAKWAIFGLAGFLFAPFAMATITGMLGLIVAGAIAGTTWFMMPVVESMAINLRLKLIKDQAAKNPIETLQSEYLRRDLLLNERKTKIETLAAKTAGFGSKLSKFKSDYPADSAVYQDIYDKMVLLLKRSREQWVVAEKQLDAFSREIERAKAKWAMALAATDLRQDAGQVEAEFMARLKVECSFDAIEVGMNTAFAQLDTLLMESESAEVVPSTSVQQALPGPNSSVVIDIPAQTSKVKAYR